jgi:hypothetical protein
MTRQNDRHVVRAFQQLTNAAGEFVNCAPRDKTTSTKLLSANLGREIEEGFGSKRSRLG